MAAAALAAVIAVIAILVTVVTSPADVRSPGQRQLPSGNSDEGAAKHTRSGRPQVAKATPAGTYGVGLLTLHLVDRTRTITLPGGRVVPRALTTFVWFPTDKRGSAAASSPAPGSFPLIVFGHGFDIMPGFYERVLRYWASAGFVVAAPIFPLENPNAPGGPNRSDLPNQPADMRFVISSLLHLSAMPSGRLHGHLDAREVAVAGHSDGGDTALALGYDPSLRDTHLQAAVILSGAEIPMLAPFKISAGGPPLLATQGTSDVINLPSDTAAFFDSAPAPKYLLQLLGGSHTGPYTTDQPQVVSVQRVTTAFLQYYLEHDHAAMRDMLHAGNVSGVADLQADP